MYGLVNKAVEDLVTSRFGEDTWIRIRERAGVDGTPFVGSASYDDKITYDLVASASAELGLPADEVLAAFGEHWVLVTGPEGYAELLDAAGKTLPEFLENLPDFHARVLLILPKLHPPEFWLSERTATSVLLHYRSHRPGLQPFVLGLLRGIGKRFSTAVEVSLRAGRADGLDHDQFAISWGKS